MSSWRKRELVKRLAQAFVLGALLVTGCGGSSKYVWYTELPKEEVLPTNDEYVIGIGDTISIRVYEQEPVSGTARIRRDGRIALPLLGELVVAGKHPSDFAKELEVKLKAFIVSPRVTVNVEQSQPITISTMGELSSKGTMTLEPPGILIQAIAQAGGLGEYADRDRIFILRQFPEFQRIRFTYDAILDNENGAAKFRLRTGDVILVE
ncbi:MAG TPA: polysaccharide biosynthesis/export family protein [Polyangiaceae bacterium]